MTELIKTKKSEDTTKRDTDKKKNFFNRKFKKINSCYIIWIETPNMQISEYGIPSNKNKSNDNRRKKELLPGFIKFYFGMKRKQERYEDGKKINKKVEESHVAFLIFNFRKYLNGTHNIPKHSPSSLPRCL